METHFDFHLGLARIGGYSRFAQELERVWYRRLMRLNWIKATACKRVPKDWHQLVVKACMTRDPEKAQKQMREHVRFGSEDDLRALKIALKEAKDHGCD
jgi:DNA-binding GntR family transcriptional regulator